MHDLLITGGVYALTGREVTTSTVAALLTILGFSLYDTIIVFDRIRENVPRMPRAAYSQIVNRSMSEVLARSLATSFCTLLPILALYFFGGETLKDFAFALIVGVASGTYSSIFIAAPVLTHWKEREPVYRAPPARIAEQLGEVDPAYAVVAGRAGRRRAARTGAAHRPSPSPRTPSAAVSQAEFDDMVRDLHVDEPPVPTATVERAPNPRAEPANATATTGRSRGPRHEGDARQAAQAKRPRNRRHGRSR